MTFDEAVDAARALDGAGLIKARTPGAWGLRLSGAMFRSCLPDVIAWTSTMVRAYQSAQRASAPSLVISQMMGALAVGGSGSTITANYGGLDEGRALLREAFTLTGDLQIISTTLHVRLDPASAPRRSRALAALAAATETHYPGTDLTIAYSVKGHDVA